MNPSWTRQHTLASPVDIEGAGLHTGEPSRMRLLPALAGTGRVFLRTDIAGAPEISLTDIAFDCAPGRTALSRDGASVETVEHLMAALAGLGVDNVRVELSGPEPPASDGSARVFVERILGAGIQAQEGAREAYVIDEPITAESDNARVIALPCRSERPELMLSHYGYSLCYDGSPLASGWFETPLTTEGFIRELAPARTFCMSRDVEKLRSLGLGRGASHDITLVIDGDRVIGNELRFANEPVRHKVLDLIGDLGLLGAPVVGRVFGFRSGHALNRKLVRQIMRACRKRPLDALFPPTVMDMPEIERILPHRYPFLLVDRVIEIEPEKRIIAVKNVSGNEEHFLGHFPGSPVMPGVLQLEALAQAAGLLLSKHVRQGERMAALVGLDGVKLRRPVVPGDRLLLNVEVKRMRKTLSVCEGRATVWGETAAEATILFGMIRNNAVPEKQRDS